MPYNKRKQKCKQSSGKAGNYVLSYTDKKGKKHRACHTSEKNMQGQIAAIEAEAAEVYGEEINEDIMRLLVKDFTSQKISESQSRLEAGSDGQATAGNAFASLVPGITFESIKKGSQEPDLVIQIPGLGSIQAEVKSSSVGSEATAFDRTMSKIDEPTPEDRDLDSVAEAIILSLGAEFVSPAGAKNGVYKLMNGTYKGKKLGKYKGDEKVKIKQSMLDAADSGLPHPGGINGFTAGPLTVSSEILGVVGFSELPEEESSKLKSSSQTVSKPESIDFVRNLWPSLHPTKSKTRQKGVFYAIPPGSPMPLVMRDSEGNYYAMNAIDAPGVLIGQDHPEASLRGRTVDLTGSTIKQVASPAGLAYSELPPSIKTDPEVIKAGYETFVKHLRENDDELFVIVSGKKVTAWSLDNPVTIGNLTINPITQSSIRAIKLAGYGGGDMGKIRLGLAISFNMATGTEITNMNESIARIFLKEALLLEGNGEDFEDLLISEFNKASQLSTGYFKFEPGADATYDIGLLNKNSERHIAKIEVKLNEEAQLGKIDKNIFGKLEYKVGENISYTINDYYGSKGKETIVNESTKNLVNVLMEKINNNDANILSKIENLAKNGFGLKDGDSLDLKKTVQVPGIRQGNKKPSPVFDSEGNEISKQLTNEPTIDSTGMFDFSNSITVSSREWSSYMSTKKDYFLLGDSGHTQASGILCSLGKDKLSLGVSPVSFGDVSVLIRFKDGGTAKFAKGDKDKTGSFTKGNGLTFETRGTAVDASGGFKFSSAKDLVTFFEENQAYSQNVSFSSAPQRSGPDRDEDFDPRSGMSDEEYWSPENAGLKRHIKNIISEMLEDQVSENEAKLIVEELTGSDKSEIKRMIAKEIEGASNKRATQKVFQAEFNKELKKALGSSFIGEPGKINKFVRDSIRKEIESMFKDKATQNQIGDITKEVMKKLYRELSFSSVQVIDRIKM